MQSRQGVSGSGYKVGHLTSFEVNKCGGSTGLHFVKAVVATWIEILWDSLHQKEFLVKQRKSFTLIILFFELKEDLLCLPCSVFCMSLLLHKANWIKKLRIFIFSQSSVPRSRMQCPKLFLRKYINIVAFMVLLTWRLANELRHKVNFLMK